MPRKGVSNNPAGRPPKSRALTEILQKALDKTVKCADGKGIAGKRLLAATVTQALTTGKATFPDGTKLILGPRDWLEMVKWAYTQIDGPPKSQVEVSGDGSAPLRIEVVYADHSIDPAAPAPGADAGEAGGAAL